jgi:hypothetical protein
MSEAKTKPSAESVQEFLQNMHDRKRTEDCLALIELMQKATACKPVMWGSSIVGFGKYTYRYANGREGDWPVIGFSPRKNDLTLYIMPGFEKYDLLLQKLGKHKTGKSCLYLKTLADVDLKVLEKIISESVKAMAGKRVE